MKNWVLLLFVLSLGNNVFAKEKCKLSPYMSKCGTAPYILECESVDYKIHARSDLNLECGDSQEIMTLDECRQSKEAIQKFVFDESLEVTLLNGEKVYKDCYEEDSLIVN